MAYNNYNAYYPATVQPTYNTPQQSYMPQQPAYQYAGICWVDGEVGAKAQQLPPGWDITKPFPMWDTNDQVIYLKSYNQVGMPNPLTKLHYTIEEASKQAPMMSSQAAALPAVDMPDMSDYVKKDDLERVKEELKAVIIERGKGNGKSAV